MDGHYIYIYIYIKNPKLIKKKKKKTIKKIEGIRKKKKRKEKKKKNEKSEVKLQVQITGPFFCLFFSLFWGENFLVGPKRKHLGPTIFFSSLPPNQTPSNKFSFLIFSPFVFSVLPKIHSTKHTLNTPQQKVLSLMMRA